MPYPLHVVPASYLGLVHSLLQTMKRLVLTLAVFLSSLRKACLAGNPAVEASDVPHLLLEPSPERACTLDELLPQISDEPLSPEWSSEYVVDPPYDCTCAAMKAR